jgi:hypothetical protein
MFMPASGVIVMIRPERYTMPRSDISFCVEVFRRY